MNESVINPWFVYLLFNIDSFIVISGISCVFSGIAIVIFLIGKGASKIQSCFPEYMNNRESSEKWYPIWANGWRKHSKYLIPLFIGCLLIIVFIPNKSTLIAMYAANSITWNKVEKTMMVTKDIKAALKKDVIDIISSLNKNEKQSNTRKEKINE